MGFLRRNRGLNKEKGRHVATFVSFSTYKLRIPSSNQKAAKFVGAERAVSGLL
jgi:hypothetical protein